MRTLRFAAGLLSLTLIVASFGFARDSNNTFSFDDLAFFADGFDRASDFHEMRDLNYY